MGTGPGGRGRRRREWWPLARRLIRFSYADPRSVSVSSKVTAGIQFAHGDLGRRQRRKGARVKRNKGQLS
jgi:hypothetical protein